MAFLRRGNITFPHKGSASIDLHRIDGSPVHLKLSEINCWEEHQLRHTLNKVVMLYHGLSSCAVRESFEEVTTLINGKAVQP